MFSMSSFYKINRRVYYDYQIVIITVLIIIVPLGITLITYRQYLQYRECIKQTELQKVVKEYALQRGAR